MNTAEDSMTIPYLKNLYAVKSESSDTIDLEYRQHDNNNTSSSGVGVIRVVRLPDDCHGSADALRFLSTDAIEEGKERYIPKTSHAVVIPSDLILEGNLSPGDNPNDSVSSQPKDECIISTLVNQHKQWSASSSGVTMLLTDVGCEDKDGIPLKESSKAKMGKFSRDEEDMEYIGLSSEVAPPLMGGLHAITTTASNYGGSRRVVLKRSKIEVEEDDGTGSTTKLIVDKSRLHDTTARRNSSNNPGSLSGMLNTATAPTASRDASPSLSLRTDLHDVHLYVISNWVFDLLHARPNMASFQKEVLPLLISRQFRGVEGAFGPTSWKNEDHRERLKRVLRGLDDETGGAGNGSNNSGRHDKISSLLQMYASAKASGGLGGFYTGDNEENDRPTTDKWDGTTPKSASTLASPSFPSTLHPYTVSAHVISRETSTLILRACTIPTLLYGCGEITSKALKLDNATVTKLVPKGTQLNTKFNTILFPNCNVGEKVQTKSCTIGSNVTLGDRSKLNNVIVMDGAVIGENVVMQNSVVGTGAKIRDYCNLKDCMVGSNAVVATGTKTTEKGEAFHS